MTTTSSTSSSRARASRGGRGASPSAGGHRRLRRGRRRASLHRLRAPQRPRDLRAQACGKPVTGFAVGPDASAFGCGSLCRTRDEGGTDEPLDDCRPFAEGVHEEAEALMAERPAIRLRRARLPSPRRLSHRDRGDLFLRGAEVEWIVNDIIDDPTISAAFGPWQKLIEGTPRLAHERFYWSRRVEQARRRARRQERPPSAVRGPARTALARHVWPALVSA